MHEKGAVGGLTRFGLKSPLKTEIKVSKSQKQFFLKLHCPKNEQNIRQNSALELKKWFNQ